MTNPQTTNHKFWCAMNSTGTFSACNCQTEATKIPALNINHVQDGYFTIPTRVLRAAAEVYQWINTQPEPYSIKLNGLQLYKDGHDD